MVPFRNLFMERPSYHLATVHTVTDRWMDRQTDGHACNR